MSGQTMKALVYEGPKRMIMRELPIPAVAEDEVLIRVEKVGICGSELSGYLGHNSLRKPPLVMGHEFSGVVAETGSAVTGLSTGDSVTANPLVTCGRCVYCTTGRAQLCTSRKLIGAARPGAFAEYVAVPVRNVYKLEPHLSFEEGAYAEPFACAVHVCRLLELAPTDRLLIVGAGPIGLFALKAAHVYGVRSIVIVDPNRGRLEIAEELGGVAAADLGELGIGSEEGMFDAALDAVGLNETRRQCVRMVKPGGRVVFTGLHEAESALPINDMIRNETRVTGAFAYSHQDFEAALQWIHEGRVNLLPWTEIAPLEQGGSCFEKLIEGPGKVAKIMLTLRD